MVTAALTTTTSNHISDYHLLEWISCETFKSIEALKGKILVIKLGGSTLEHQRSVLQDIIWLRSMGACPVLVHGGGPYINEWLAKLNIQARFENGLRVTDSQTLEVVRMVLLGQLNPQLVLMTSQMGGRAIGLSGTDGGMVRAHIANERLGFVGEIDAIDVTPVRNLLEAGYIPIIAPLGEAPDGTCLNINADLVASHLAGALDAAKLLFLSNVVGICRSNGEVIPEVTEAQARWLIEDGVITGGMIPKVQACLDALATVPCVHILDGREPHTLLQGVLTRQTGTMMVR
ncbi:MAG: acetylglutamate kinase [Ktedonobacteraceae bacterium]|nr:acetylglutamate kinase [Ktedonobacteraceae bacterium]